MKRCTEARKRKAASTPEVLEARINETLTRVECVLEAVPTETSSVVPTSIIVQEIDSDPIPIQKEPAAAQLEHSTPDRVELDVELASLQELGARPGSVQVKYPDPDSTYPDRVMCQFPTCGRLHLRNEYPRVFRWTCLFAPDYGAGGMVPSLGWGSLPRWYWSTETQEEWCWYMGQKGKPELIQFEPRPRPQGTGEVSV